MENIKRIERSHAQFASQLAGLPSKLQIRNIHQLGTILAFEIDAGEYSYLNARGPAITRMALREGIYLRPLGNTVYLMPPYCTTPAQLSQVYQFLTNLITSGMEQL
jgi:adenosylmethionine-8-amino-7-oxononanoate aminotransferase